MSDAGFGFGLGFFGQAYGDFVVDEYFMAQDDGDIFVTESNEYLIVADYSDN
jgi:hypothetical protein